MMVARLACSQTFPRIAGLSRCGILLLAALTFAGAIDDRPVGADDGPIGAEEPAEDEQERTPSSAKYRSPFSVASHAGLGFREARATNTLIFDLVRQLAKSSDRLADTEAEWEILQEQHRVHQVSDQKLEDKQQEIARLKRDILFSHREITALRELLESLEEATRYEVSVASLKRNELTKQLNAGQADEIDRAEISAHLYRAKRALQSTQTVLNTLNEAMGIYDAMATMPSSEGSAAESVSERSAGD